MVKNFLGALRGLAETCVEMRKLDRSRALRISKADSDEWKRFAMTTLREALDYLVARLPVVADKFGASPQAATQAQQLLGERYIAIEDFMNIELDDQHVEGRIAVRDKAIRWGTNGFFAVGGYLLHALGPKLLALIARL
ncbi:hypothetical protein HDE79_000697 [Rhodanobacter sp. MP1X3]|nr:hypothetical protein [Rhodanobacter sp. MP1X3]